MTAQPDLFPEAARLTDERGEYARTPAWLIEAGLRLLPLAVAPGEVLDLGAGLGDLAAACWRRWPAIRVTTVEREADRCAEMRRRWPAWTVREADVEAALSGVSNVRPGWPLIVCNPPFTRSLEWARLALGLLARGGALRLVQPLEHLGGLERWQPLYRDRPPAGVGIAPRRPKGAGWDDARAIVVAVWSNAGGTDASGRWVPFRVDTTLVWLGGEP